MYKINVRFSTTSRCPPHPPLAGPGEGDHHPAVFPQPIVRDSGLLHALLNIETLDRLSGHPVIGASWEGFVLENLLAALPWRTQPLFYRTAVGAEIDLVLERPDGERWAIEIKRGLAAKLERGFHHARQDLAPAKAFVVYSGEERYPVADGVEAIGLREMAAVLAAS